MPRSPAAPPPKASSRPAGRVVGLDYRTTPLLPHEIIFDCAKHHASFPVSGCAHMWRLTNERHSDRYTACQSCFIGATHAGVSDASRSPIRGALVCARCTRGATRLIHSNLCVSCYNREREMIRGRNARGAVPTKLPPLAPRAIYILSNGRPQLVRSERTVSVTELIVATMRDAVHSVTFGWRAHSAGLRQLRLF